jgi:D-alanine transaminase
MAKALPIAYLNGSYLPIEAVRISPLDRGFLFGDAIYEVIPVYGGRPLLLDAHLRRLAGSLAAIRIASPHDERGWTAIIEELVRRNGGADMGIYLQVSRGADAGRDHFFPAGVAPTVFGLASPLAPIDPAQAGVRAVTAPEIRWRRCDIKSTSLLANILARQSALDRGANEVIFLDGGFVTEGSASSVIVAEGDVLFSRPNGHEILPGTTIELVRELAVAAGYGYREERVSEPRLRRAAEIWLLGAARGVSAVIELDGEPVGAGVPGPIWRRVNSDYEKRKRPGA